MEPNELITQLYVGYYNRAPDPEGLNYWMGRLAAGVSLADIAESFATSPEAISTYPWLAVEEPTEGQVGAFLEAIYQNMFNRSIDSDGLAYYSAQLLSGERTAGEIIASIQANANTNPNNDDGQILANKVEVGLAWAAGAEAQPGFEYNAEAAASANSILDGVNASQASVDAALDNVEEFFDAPASLEGALEALFEAREAVAAQQAEIADFLEGSFSNEFVAAVTTDGADADATIDADDVTEADIAEANEGAADAIVTLAPSVAADGAAFVALTDAQQEARIESARGFLQADINDAQVDVGASAEDLEVGVADLVAAAQVRADALDAALDAQDVQDAETDEAYAAAGAVATTTNTNNNDPVAFQDDTQSVVGVVEATDGNSTVDITTVSASGQVSFSSAVSLNAAGTIYTIDLGGGDSTTVTRSYLDAVLAAAQADVDAFEAVESAQDSLADAVLNVVEAQDDNFSGTGVDYAELVADGAITVDLATNAVTLDYAEVENSADAPANTTATTALNTYASDVAALDAAEQALTDFNEAVADWQETDQLVDQLESLNEELTELGNAENRAELQITNDENGTPAGLNTGLFEGTGTVTFGAGDDVYLFAEDTSGTPTDIENFGVAGEDSIYFGAGYKLVALGDDDINDNVGSVSDLEIFWQETAGGDLVLYVENETFAGNGSTTGDITTITLEGVSADEVALVGGFLVEAEATVA